MPASGMLLGRRRGRRQCAARIESSDCVPMGPRITTTSSSSVGGGDALTVDEYRHHVDISCVIYTSPRNNNQKDTAEPEWPASPHTRQHPLTTRVLHA